MNIPIDEVVYFDAIASSSMGGEVDADSTPTFAVYEESTDTDIGIGGNMTKRTSLTGRYRGSFTVSSANGFEAGKWYTVIGSAIIDTISLNAVLMHFRVIAGESVTNAELATALATADDAVLVQVALVKAKTDNLPADPADQSAVETAILTRQPTIWATAASTVDLSGTTVGLTAAAIASIWTTALTEAYRTIGATGTGAQLMYETMRNITAFTIAATTKTVKKLDGSTTAKTYTLDDATNPTSITEAS